MLLSLLSIAGQSKKALSDPAGTLAFRNIYPSLTCRNGVLFVVTGVSCSIHFGIAA